MTSDLSAFEVRQNFPDKVIIALKHVFVGEESNRAVKFVVKDVQDINAEVNLVKCIVWNIVLDVSLNQIRGLCTLSFLEG